MIKKLRIITGITNNKRTLVVNIKLSKKIIKILENLLMKYDEWGEYFEIYEYKSGTSNRINSPKALQDTTISFFDKEETGFLIFKKKHAQIILLKNSNLFKEIEKEIFKVFDFIKPETPKKTKA